MPARVAVTPLTIAASLVSELPLPDDAAHRWGRIGADAPNSVEAVVVAVKPEREPAGLAFSRPGRSHFVFCPELAVERGTGGVANDGRTRLRALHRSDESRRTASAGNGPRSRRGNRRRRQNLVADERAVCRTSVIPPRAVEAVPVCRNVDGQPAGAAGAVPLSVDPIARSELAGEPVSVRGVGSDDAIAGLRKLDGRGGRAVYAGLLDAPRPRDVGPSLGRNRGRGGEDRQSAAH